MKTKTWLIFTLSVMAFVLTSCVGCNRVKPNCEGVLMQHYGRNGKDDFKLVQGSQGVFCYPEANCITFLCGSSVRTLPQ